MEFPELKEKAYQHYCEWTPDAFIVEGKATGMPLIFELRQMGIPVTDFTPSRGNGKIARVNAVADLFHSGIVWAPQTRWAEEVVEQFASFPSGSHDDLVDSSTQALLRFRQGKDKAMAIDKPLVSGPFPEEEEEMIEVDTEQEDPDVSIGVLNPEAVSIETEDGGVIIEFDPRSEEDDADTSAHDANLARS